MASCKCKRYALKKIKFNTFFSSFYVLRSILHCSILITYSALCHVALFIWLLLLLFFLMPFQSFSIYFYLSIASLTVLFLASSFRIGSNILKMCKGNKQKQKKQSVFLRKHLAIDYCNDGVTKINALRMNGAAMLVWFDWQ